MKEVKRSFFSSLGEVATAVGSALPMPIFATSRFAVASRFMPMPVINALIELDTPYRVDDYRFILFHKADIDLWANLKKYHIEGGMLGFIGNGGIIQFDKIAPADAQISAVLLNYDYMRYILNGRLPKMLDNKHHNFAISLTRDEIKIVEQMIELAFTMLHQPDCDESATNMMFATFVNYVSSIYERNASELPKSKSRAEAVFSQFIALVNEHCTTRHTLDFYASQCCITERYLGTLVRKASGMTAKEWIDRAIIAEAKVALKHSDIGVTELSERLNFPNVAFFCKYFKRLTGLTPSSYRES